MGLRQRHRGVTSAAVRPMGRLALVAAIIGCAHGTASMSSTPTPDFYDACAPRAQVLLVGTFHFADAGLDSYKPQFSFDPSTAAHQRQIADVVGRLARYRPTKVAIESRNQRRLDSLYRAYRAGTFALGPNEIFQIGFRLAARLGHDHVYAVDAPGREYDPTISDSVYGSRRRQYAPADSTWDVPYQKFYRYTDSVKSVWPLRATLLYINSPAYLRQDHGAYLVGAFAIGRDTSYFGPDIATAWWNRNLRIFNNLQRITNGPNERLLVLIGGGHVALLSHNVASSPSYRLVDLRDVLGDAAPGGSSRCGGRAPA